MAREVKALWRSLPASRAAVSVVDEVVGEISGYVAIWGDPDHRDSYGTWFSKAKPPSMALDYVPFPIIYNHAYDEEIGQAIIGKITEVGFDDVGIWFKGNLDRSCKAFPRIVDELKRGILATSSATSPHLADFDEDGRFVSWVLIEVSLCDNPSESRMPKVILTRSRAMPRGQRQAGGAAQQTPHRLLKITHRNSNLMAIKKKQNIQRKPPAAPKPAATLDTIRASLSELLAENAQDASPEELVAAIIEQFGIEAIAGLVQEMATPQEPAPIDDERSEDEGYNAEGEFEDEGDNLGEPAPQFDIQMLATMIADALNLQGRSTPRQQDRGDQQPVRGQQSAPSQRSQQRQTALPTRNANGQPLNLSPIAPRGQQQTSQRSARIIVSSKFDQPSAADLAWGAEIMRSAGEEPSDDYLTALAYKTALLVEKGDEAATDLSVIRSFPFRSAAEVRQSDVGNLMRTMRAGEIANGGAGEGGDWLGNLHGTELWMKVRQANPVYNFFLKLGMEEQELPQGFNSKTFNLEDDDPEFYVAAMTSDLDTNTGEAYTTYGESQHKSDKKDATVAKLSMRLPLPQELIEDSLVPLLKTYNDKIKKRWEEIIEDILLNGDDTLANTNINSDTNPAAAPLRPHWTLLDGFLYQALTAQPLNKRDAGDALSETDFLALMPLLGDDGVLAADIDKLAYVVDTATYFACLNLASLKTHDVFANATIENGVLSRIWGVPVLKSARMKKAKATGQVSSTPSNNTKGRVALIRPDQAKVLWKRRMSTAVTRFERQDLTEITAHSRWGLVIFDPKSVAVSFNLNTTIGA